MTEFDIKTKTFGKCRVYPDNPQGMVPSVTSITGALMKYGLIDWAANCAVDYFDKAYICDDGGIRAIGKKHYTMLSSQARTAHERIRDAAGDIGIDIHDLCKLYLESYHSERKGAELDKALDTANDLQKKMIKNFMDWCEKNWIEPVHIELKLHGDGYSGRCDLVAYRSIEENVKVLGLYDIKTTPTYYEDQGLQLAAYAEAYDNWQIESAGDYDYVEPIKRINEIGIIRLDKKSGSCNFSEKKTKRSPEGKFTPQRERFTKSFMALKDFYWTYNDLETQFKEINNETPRN